MSRLCKNMSLLGGVSLLLAVCSFVAPSAQAADADHPVFSELNVDWRIVGSTPVGSKFIEICNPTIEDFDLSNVYLSNASNGINQYYNIVNYADAGGGAGGTFHCRFPAGFMLTEGDTIVISLSGSDEFQTAYGFLPDFELYEDGLEPDEVAEMVSAFPGAVSAGLADPGTNLPGLAFGSGAIMMYRWDGVDDLVEDLDYVCWGDVVYDRIDKSGILIDGPDGDALDSVYNDDTPIGDQNPVNPDGGRTFGESLQRVSISEDDEVTSGGNGPDDGHDETSENFFTGWQVAGYAVAGPPASRVAPAPVITEVELSPAVPNADEDAIAIVTAIGYEAVTAVTVFYSIDGAPFTDSGADDNGDETWSAIIPGQALGAELRWYAVAASGGTEAGWPVHAPVGCESATFSEAPEPGDGPAHLLITEVNYNYPEFIEIHNPTAADVDLGNYYLTDAVYYTTSGYWNLPAANPEQSTVGGGAYYDFTARMPAGMTIPAGGYVTVSVSGSSGFAGTFSFMPSCELYEDDASADDVPDLRDVFPGSIFTNPDEMPTLTNLNVSEHGGEIVVLFYWDGTTDLVTDIDVFTWGDGNNYQLLKTTSITVDGPDADGDATAYAADTGTAGHTMMTAPASGETYQRIGDEGAETATGGNGVGGHDETSEDVSATFTTAAADPAVPDVPEVDNPGIAIKVPARTFLPDLGGTFPIRFTSLPNSQTLVRIFDLEGRSIITLFDNREHGSPAVMPGTFTRVNWDGRDRLYERLPAGMYIIHLSVVNEATGEESHETAPVVIATRLSN